MTRNGYLPRDVPPYTFEDGSPARHPWVLFIFAFNEGKKLETQLSRLPPVDERGFDVVLGDDGSTDGSCPASFLGRFHLRGIVRLGRNRGLSPNVKAGFDWLLEQDYRGVVMMNGNDRDGVEALPLFLEKLAAGIGYVQGSRFRPGGEHVNTPPYRLWSIRLVHAPLFSLAAGHWLTDTTNGYRAFSTEALRAMGDGLFSPRFQHYEIEQYLAWKALRCGIKSCEIPVARRYQADTKTQPYSKIRPGIGWWHMLKPLFGLLVRAYR
jgi:dolichol-phosphate mannosyltransferase